MDELTALLSNWGPTGATIATVVGVIVLIAKKAWPAVVAFIEKSRTAQQESVEAAYAVAQTQATTFRSEMDAVRSSYALEMQKERDANREQIASIVAGFRTDQAETRGLIRDLMALLRERPLAVDDSDRG